MGVWVTANVVKKVKGKVQRVKGKGITESRPIYYLNDLIFNAPMKKSLIEIADKELDLDFFTQHNGESYGNDENINTSFKPDEVLKCVNLIRRAFNENESKFVQPISYDGIYDKNGKRTTEVFVEMEVKRLIWKKTITRRARFITSEDNPSLQWYNDWTGSWVGIIDLIKSKPKLFYLLQEGQNYTVGERIDYELRAIRFYQQIQPELSNIEEIANYARNKGLELQMRQD